MNRIREAPTHRVPDKLAVDKMQQRSSRLDLFVTES